MGQGRPWGFEAWGTAAWLGGEGLEKARLESSAEAEYEICVPSTTTKEVTLFVHFTNLRLFSLSFFLFSNASETKWLLVSTQVDRTLI